MIKKTFSLIFSLILVIFMIVGIYKILRFTLTIFSQINPSVGAGIIAATATITVSVISVLVAKHLEQKAILLKEHRERKTPNYEEMVQLIFRFAFADKLGLPPLSDQEVNEKMAKFTENLVIWGSDDLILAWNRFRTHSPKTDQSTASYQILFEVETLLLAIRKDLGHANKKLSKGSVLGLFVNDLDKVIDK